MWWTSVSYKKKWQIFWSVPQVLSRFQKWSFFDQAATVPRVNHVLYVSMGRNEACYNFEDEVIFFILSHQKSWF